ncbi:MAG: MBL fold metallo-hydrolase [Chthoniobacterales bacterium]|nr:MBL fold metallo-hydrolase [Chthoniobacterales bacterium]
MKFINLTRRTEIGANSYYLGSDGQGMVLDSGMHPKEIGEAALPNLAALGGRPVDAILISHAHLDHIGSLPVLMRQQAQAQVFMTAATTQIGEALLHNSINVMTRQREEVGAAIYPLYGHRETDRATGRWRACPLRQPINLAGERSGAQPNDEIDFEFWDAGHVLGAAGIFFRIEGRKVFYTGDVNFDDQTLSRGATFPEEPVDVLIIETTHGATALPEGFTRAAEEERFAEALNEAFARGGCVLVPVFALGKTQEILTLLYQFKRAQKISDVPIYIGGLSAKMTEIYDRRAHDTARVVPELELFPAVQPFVLNGRSIGEAPARPGRVYALSSGMMTPKTLSNIFARRLLENPEHSIFFVGYADPVSPAGLLRAAQPNDLVSLDEDEPAQVLRCQVKQFQFSAHAPRQSLLDYIAKVSPRKVVLVHGDPPAVEWMRAATAKLLPESEVIVPSPGVEIEL